MDSMINFPFRDSDDLLAALVEFMGSKCFPMPFNRREIQLLMFLIFTSPGTLLFLLLGLGGIQAAATANLAHETASESAIKTASMQQLVYIATS
jgi:hypothetical protein